MKQKFEIDEEVLIVSRSDSYVVGEIRSVGKDNEDNLSYSIASNGACFSKIESSMIKITERNKQVLSGISQLKNELHTREKHFTEELKSLIAIQRIDDM